MPLCTQHPDRETGAACEYCARPFCGECLRPLLGRSYCGECFERVQSVATGRKPQRAAAQSGTRMDPGNVGTPAPQPKLSGWLSAALYLVVLAILLPVIYSVAQSPMLLVKFAVLATGRAADLRDLMSISGIGWAGWLLLFAAFTWGSFLMVLLLTTGLGRVLERRSVADLGLAWEGVRPGALLTATIVGALWAVAVVGVNAGRARVTLTPAFDLPNFGWIALLAPPAAFILALPLAALEGAALRGYLMTALQRAGSKALGEKWGELLAVTLSAVAFALFHAQHPHFREHPWLAVPLVFTGIFLAWQTLKARSIWPSVFTWTAWLTVQSVVGLPVSAMGLPAPIFRPFVAIFSANSTLPLYWSAGAEGFEAALLLCLTSLLLLGSLTVLAPLFKKRPTLEGSRDPRPVVQERTIPLSSE